MTQYVEKFALPIPDTETGREIIALAKLAYEKASSDELAAIGEKLDKLIWKGFGLSIEEAAW